MALRARAARPAEGDATSKTLPLLPYDVLYHIFSGIDDTETLFVSTLVSRSFNEAATPHLYRAIEIFDDANHLHETGVLKTLRVYPHLRNYIKAVKHWGAGEQRDTASLTVTPLLADLRNLESYTLLSCRFSVSTEFFEQVVEALLKHRSGTLKRVHFNIRISQRHFLSLSKLSGVQSLTVERPSRRFIEQLGPWLNSSMPEHLVEELSVIDATKVDAITVAPLLPHIGHLRKLSIGKGHDLSSIEILDVLRYTGNLETLEIYYDNFIVRHPLSRAAMKETLALFSGLPRLSTLTITHSGVGRSPQFRDMFTWARFLAQHSTSLQCLTVISDDLRKCKTPGSTILLELIEEHAQTMKDLVVPHVELSKEQLRRLLSLPQLEVLKFCLVNTTPMRKDHEPLNRKDLYQCIRAYEPSVVPEKLAEDRQPQEDVTCETCRAAMPSGSAPTADTRALRMLRSALSPHLPLTIDRRRL